MSIGEFLMPVSRKLETNLKKTVDEIAEVETTIRRLKDAIWDKDAPNKVGTVQELQPRTRHKVHAQL